jgi:hypothetical protein
MDWDRDYGVLNILIFKKYSKLIKFISGLEAYHSFMKITTPLSPKEIVEAGIAAGGLTNTILGEGFNVHHSLFKKGKLVNIVEKEDATNYELLRESVSELQKMIDKLSEK